MLFQPVRQSRYTEQDCASAALTTKIDIMLAATCCSSDHVCLVHVLHADAEQLVILIAFCPILQRKVLKMMLKVRCLLGDIAVGRTVAWSWCRAKGRP